jgi:hypothetical protein
VNYGASVVTARSNLERALAFFRRAVTQGLRFGWQAVIALNVAAAITVVGAWFWHQFGGGMQVIEYAGLIIVLILLWIRPEYMFLLFYVLANYLLVFLISDAWRLTWADAPTYAMYSAIRIAITLAIGAVIVALFKWLRTRATEHDQELDREIARIRAGIEAREGGPPEVGGERP